MKNTTLLMLLILAQVSSCNVYDKGFVQIIEFPVLYLKNSTSNTISVESYYFDKHTNKDILWENQAISISPTETKKVMDWVFPKRLLVRIDGNIVFDYIGSNNQLNDDGLNTVMMKIVSTEAVFDDIKYNYNNIPFNMYDFSWLGNISNVNKFRGHRYNLVFGE
jgi:hypothetical protein